jgi:SpoVK/Ycf46/Vps4 family AAA+-type ATPase
MRGLYPTPPERDLQPMSTAFMETEARREEVTKPKKGSLKVSLETHAMADMHSGYTGQGINELCDELLRDALRKLLNETQKPGWEEVVARRAGLRPVPKRKGNSA